MTEGAPNRRVVWGVFVVATGLYLLTLEPRSDGQLLAADVWGWCDRLQRGDHGIHYYPHHLLFHVLARIVNAALGMGGDVSFVSLLRGHQIVSAVGGGATVALLVRFALRMGDRTTALLMGATLMTTWGLWFNAAAGETLTCACAATVGLLAAASEGCTSGRQASMRRLVGWLLLATLLRQDAVFVVIALAVLLPLRRAVCVTAIAGLLSLVTHAIGWKLSGDPRSLLAWLVTLAETGGHSPDLHALSSTLRSMALSIAPGRPSVRLEFAAAVPLSGILGLGLVALALYSSGRPRGPGRWRVAWALGLFVAVRLVFFLWWFPTETEYLAGSLAFLAMIAALTLRQSGCRRVRIVLLVCLCWVAGSNLWVMSSLRDRRASSEAQRALELAGPDAVYVSLDSSIHASLIRENDRVMSLLAQPGDEARLLRELARLRRKRRVVAFVRGVAFSAVIRPQHSADDSMTDRLMSGGRVSDREVTIVSREAGPWMVIERAR